MTQAWLKFYEILSNIPELISTSVDLSAERLTTLHLCEAPGAFISALMSYWTTVYRDRSATPDWQAATLNPHHEESDPGAVIRVDTLILEFPERWVFGTVSWRERDLIISLDNRIPLEISSILAP